LANKNAWIAWALMAHGKEYDVRLVSNHQEKSSLFLIPKCNCQSIYGKTGKTGSPKTCWGRRYLKIVGPIRRESANSIGAQRERKNLFNKKPDIRSHLFLFLCKFELDNREEPYTTRTNNPNQ
jgi:hypothetical protein